MHSVRKISLTLFLAVALTQSGCETFYGPVIMNRSATPLKFVATFSGRVVECELKPGGAYRQRSSSLILEALRVTDGIRTKDFSGDEIRSALTEAGRSDRAVVELLGVEQVRGTSTKDLSR